MKKFSLTAPEAVQELYKVRKKLEDQLVAIGRRKWRASEKAMAQGEVQQHINAIDIAIVVLQGDASVVAGTISGGS